jgi:hypothetical protein
MRGEEEVIGSDHTDRGIGVHAPHIQEAPEQRVICRGALAQTAGTVAQGGGNTPRQKSLERAWTY